MNENIPSQGFILELWNTSGYRATALAYMQRENLNIVEHSNGKWYTITQIKNAMIHGETK